MEAIYSCWCGYVSRMFNRDRSKLYCMNCNRWLDMPVPIYCEICAQEIIQDWNYMIRKDNRCHKHKLCKYLFCTNIANIPSSIYCAKHICRKCTQGSIYLSTLQLCLTHSLTTCSLGVCGNIASQLYILYQGNKRVLTLQMCEYNNCGRYALFTKTVCGFHLDGEEDPFQELYDKYPGAEFIPRCQQELLCMWPACMTTVTPRNQESYCLAHACHMAYCQGSQQCLHNIHNYKSGYLDIICADLLGLIWNYIY